MGKDTFLNLIPIGKVKRIYFKKNLILLRNFGNILEELPLPFSAYLVIEEQNSKKIDEIIIISKNHLSTVFKIKILDIFYKYKYYSLFYEMFDPFTIYENFLFCIEEEVLKNSTTFYYYHLKDKEVYDSKNQIIGRVKNYMESSAHGILIIQLEIPPNKEIFIPFVEEYCKIEFLKTEAIKKIDKIVVFNWEYFLET